MELLNHIINSFGGAIVLGTSIATVLSTFLTKHLLAKETETFKMKLKRAEFIFNARLEAAKDLYTLVNNFIDLDHVIPAGLDKTVTDSQMLEKFVVMKKKIKPFLNNHAPILPPDLERELKECTVKIDAWQHSNDNVTRKGVKTLPYVLKTLTESNNKLSQLVRDNLEG